MAERRTMRDTHSEGSIFEPSPLTPRPLPFP
jgi:hypothetical protein